MDFTDKKTGSDLCLTVRDGISGAGIKVHLYRRSLLVKNYFQLNLQHRVSTIIQSLNA
jgi:hypothetical protein